MPHVAQQMQQLESVVFVKFVGISHDFTDLGGLICLGTLGVMIVMPSTHAEF